MSLKETINADVIAALKNHDSQTVATLRLLKNAISTTEINKQAELSEEDVIGILKKQAKDRQEAMAMYKQAGKDAAYAQEESELKIIQAYLPAEMPDSELMPIIDQAITEVKPQSMADFGKIMGVLAAKLKGKVDGTRLAEIIKQKLAE